MAIYFYNLMNFILFPIYFLILLVHIFKKKDNIESVAQRLASKMTTRPNGDVIWIHAASVGESMVAITLVNELNKIHPDNNYLITTGTLSSANILKKILPSNVIHQFTPIDNLFIIDKFINHWQPRLGIFIESELWPCLISQASKKFNLMLINARLSDKSYKNWQKHRQIFQQIINNFKQVIVQSKTDLEKYKNLGCNKVVNLGNIKFANKKLQVNKNDLKDLRSIFCKRKVFVASSTHPEDEAVILKVIQDLKDKKINYYPIIAPRHPKRSNELVKECNKLGLSCSIRSKDHLPLLEKDLYIVDNFGELGLFYSLAFMSFIGGSFAHGGHNLMEPAFFNNIITFGPNMSNFQNIADDMIANRAALQINNAKELSDIIEFFFKNQQNKEASNFAKNAHNYLAHQENILNNYIKEIDKFLK